MALQASPEFKGIKTWHRAAPARSRLQASPEFKGIKTIAHVQGLRRSRLQASPEFKGIKTYLLGVGG